MNAKKVLKRLVYESKHSRSNLYLPKDLTFNHGKFARFIVQVRPECYEHADCPSYDICDQGNCIDACRVTTCGSNARCENKIHAASCICLPNYVGNPRVACNPRKLKIYVFIRLDQP